VLLGLFGLAVVMLIWRFTAGLGAVTHMSDRYPFGLWIAYDVVTGTALACGGYALAILIYIVNKGKFHPLIRSAIVTSALGYTLGGASVIVDIGRWWNSWKIVVQFWNWNFTSILLEVALCIMAYTLVLWIELAPAFLEGAQTSKNAKWRDLANKTLPSLNKAMPFIIALGVLLPTMHQSSLGSLMMLAGQKVHPLWQTPMLPLLFLISCIAMGYGVVVLESSLSSKFFKLPRETDILRRLGNVVSPILALYVTLRLVDIVLRGKLGLIFTSGGMSLLFFIEMALFILPVYMFYARPAPKLGYLFRAAMLIVLAGSLYRFSTFLIAFRPSEGWVYFPSIAEIMITTGLIAGEIAAYVFLVKKFPILQGRRTRQPLARPLSDDVLKQVPIPSPAPAGGD
jgi:Ni/Fe-hydrogenase subunit HybB-like protein